MRHRHPVHRRPKRLGIIPPVGIAIQHQIVGDALLIVAFHVGHEVGPIPPPRLPRGPGEITPVAQCRLRKGRR